MRNRQQPPSGISGEILSNSAPDPFHPMQSVERRATHLPTAHDFSGILNIAPTLKAWGQRRGMESLARAIDSYTTAVRSRERLATAIIDLELVETRLTEINSLKQAAVLEIERQLRVKEEEVAEQEHQAELRKLSRELEKEEMTLKVLNARFKRQREEAKLSGSAPAEKSIDEQLAELSEALIAAQRELFEGEKEGRLSEAQIHVMETKISVILRKIDKLRQQEEPT